MLQGIQQGLRYQVNIVPDGSFPADHLSGENIFQGGQIDESSVIRQESEVGDPNFIWSVNDCSFD